MFLEHICITNIIFSYLLTAIRADERKVLEKAAYVQSISSATAPVVPVMASVFTFLALVLSGNDLSPVDVSCNKYDIITHV